MTIITLGIPGNVAEVMADYISRGDRYGVRDKALAGEPITYLEMRTFGGIITPIISWVGRRGRKVAFVCYWIDKPVTSVHWIVDKDKLTLMGQADGQHNATKEAAVAFFKRFYDKTIHKKGKRHHAKLAKKCHLVRANSTIEEESNAPS